MSPGLAHGDDLAVGLLGWRCAFIVASDQDCSNPSITGACVMSWSRAGLPFGQNVALPIRYDDIELESGYLADIIVNREVIVELKAVERFNPLHEAQLMTYLRLSSCRIGLLINFNTLSLTDGIRRRVL